MILIIDNYDSFVHNLARYLREAGASTHVVRNDAISASECLALDPVGIVISPGPKTPTEAGVSIELIKSVPATMPILGVCLGHQCLVEAFGGLTHRALHPLHGEATPIRHCGEGLFAGVPSPTMVGRYHSLIPALSPDSPLIETCWSEEGEVMGVQHKERPWFGVQFHPESLLTVDGRKMIANFFETCRRKK